MNSRPINDYLLEMYVLGILSNKKSREIKSQIDSDKSLEIKLEKIKKSNLDFKVDNPSDIYIPKIIERYKKKTDFKSNDILIPKERYKYWIFAVPTLVAALLLIIILSPIEKEKVSKQNNKKEYNILKGNQDIDVSLPQLIIHRKRNDNIEILKDESKGKTGDLLQLAYIPADQTHGVILSIDGNGKVSLHYPLEGSDSTSLGEAKFFFPESIELDNAPEFERFFFITSNSKIDIEYVLKMAGKLGNDPNRAKKENLELPENLKQVSINIIKER